MRSELEIDIEFDMLDMGFNPAIPEDRIKYWEMMLG